MEGKQTRVANAMDTHHAAGAPAPGPPSGSWNKEEREREKKSQQDPFNSKEENSLRSFCPGFGDWS